MLKSKVFSPEPGAIFGMRITTGEEIIAKLISKTDESYEVFSPLALVATQTGPSLAPLLYMMSDSKKVVIYKSAVVAEFDIDAMTHKSFEQATTTIALA